MQPTRTASYPAAQLLQGTFVPTVLDGEAPAELGVTGPEGRRAGDLAAENRRALAENQPAADVTVTRAPRATERAERADRNERTER